MKVPESLKATGSCVGTYLALCAAMIVVTYVAIFVIRHLVLVVVAAAVGGTVYWYVKRHRPRYYLVQAGQRYMWSPREYCRRSERIRLMVYVFIVRAQDASSAEQVVEQLVSRAYEFSIESDQEGARIGQRRSVTCRDRAGGAKSHLTLQGFRSSHLTLGDANKAASRLIATIESVAMGLEPTVNILAVALKDWQTSSGDEFRDGRLVPRNTASPLDYR